MSRVVVIGVGNALRGDDAAGLAVAERVRAQSPPDVAVHVCEQEPSRLVDAWGDADVAFVVDAVATGAPPGTIHRFDASDGADSSASVAFVDARTRHRRSTRARPCTWQAAEPYGALRRRGGRLHRRRGDDSGGRGRRG